MTTRPPSQGDGDDELLRMNLRDISLDSPDLDMSVFGFVLCTDRDGKGIPDLPQELDESIAEGVKQVECPNCHHRFPV